MAFYNKNHWDTFATVLPGLFQDYKPKEVIEAIIDQLEEKKIFAELDSEQRQDLIAAIKMMEATYLGLDMNFHPVGTDQCKSIREKAIRAYKEAALLV